MLKLSAIALVLSASNASAQDDWGGSVVERRLELGELIFNDELIRRETVCASACTMYLLLGPERVCTSDDALWGFHNAYLPSTGEISQQATEIVVSMYPIPLQAWFWHTVNGRDFVFVSWSTIIKHVWASRCE